MQRDSAEETAREIGWRLSFFAAALLVWGAAGCEAKKRPSDQVGEEAERARQMGAQTEDRRGGDEPRGPRRIIVMIGDGMGAAAITGASYRSSERLEMLSMDHLNFITTHSYEYVTTDSAASATAFATGEKTHYQGLSVEPGTSREEEENPDFHLRTLLERAEKRGWKTGLVSTVRTVHATPAAFASHRAHRDSYEAIAADLVDSGVDVLLGGGRKYFRDRSDGVNLLERMEGSGFEIAHGASQFRSAVDVADRLAGFFADADSPPVRSGEREVGLAERTRGALSVLDRGNDEGFLLMVEGSQIDWRGHGLDGRGIVESTRHFDRAVGAALEYAREREDTLVAVMADHETGGLSILDGTQHEKLREALGGAEEIERRVSYRSEKGKSEEIPDPMPAMPVEAGGDGASEQLVPVYGHLSMASRRYADDPSQFWSIHTPELVPLFTEGKGAAYVAEAGDNAAVGSRLEELIRGERSTGTLDTAKGSPSSREERPRNVLLFVGDGVGFDAWTAAHYGSGSLSVRTMDHQGLASPRGREALVPDDAAAATALATGRRAQNGRLASAAGSSESAEPIETVLEAAEKRGYRTGIVTTESLTDPTVAAFYTHGTTEMSPGSIASAFVGLPSRLKGTDGVDLAYGGGAAAFGEERIERLEGRGVDAGTSWAGGGDTGRQVVRLLGERALSAAPPSRDERDGSTRPRLEKMTRAALERLRSWHDPFFLVVEAGGTGRLQRRIERSSTLVDAVAEFDRAVEAGVEFAGRDGRTLVVATADVDQTLSVFDNHYGFSDGVCGVAERCGGPLKLEPIDVAVEAIPDAEGFADSALQGEYTPPRIFLQYAWPVQAAASKRDGGANAANFVPVFASGPWSNRLEGAIEQRAIGELLKRWARKGP